MLTLEGLAVYLAAIISTLTLSKHWPHKVKMWDMLNVDFRPFWACYVYRVLLACFCAMFWRGKYDFVYSASDFLMDSLPAAIMKIRGVSRHWVAGFYLFAPKDNLAYQISTGDRLSNNKAVC